MPKKENKKANVFKIVRPAKLKIIESKDDNQQGIIEAYVSIFDNEDSVGDVIKMGAFAKSLARKLPKGVWSHKWDQPVAKTLEAREDGKGLFIKGQFNLDTIRGREAYSDIKFGIFDEFSIGFSIEKSFIDDKGRRVITEAKLYEWSPVLAGANPETELVSIKSGEKRKKVTKEQTSGKKDEEKGIIRDELEVDEEDRNRKWLMVDNLDRIIWKFYDVYFRATTPSSDFKKLVDEMIELINELADDYQNVTKSDKKIDLKSIDKKRKAFIQMFKQVEKIKSKKGKVENVKFSKDSVEIKFDNGKSREYKKTDNYKKIISERKARKSKVEANIGGGKATSKKILRIRQVAKQTLKSSEYLLRITK